MNQNGKIIALFTAILLAGARLYAQNGCATMGQTPTTAFPVCGNSVFQQSSVPICPGTSVPNSCNYDIPDTNPFYYTFTCFKGGTLGFVITPNNLGDDYDWALFDITGQNPNAIYTDASLIVAYDWSGTVGLTGASTSGTQLRECESSVINGVISYVNPFSSMPTLILSHTYLLLISHYTQTQSGYSLSFGGSTNIDGSAVITDTTPPRLQSGAPSNCGPTTVKIALNKKMLCSSLAADGSDFALVPAGPAITAATGDYCNSGFDMDSVTLTFAGPIPAGNYLIEAQNGTDGNTLLDICGTAVPVGDSVAFSVPPPTPAPLFDSLSPVGCAPSVLTAVFSKDILCSSVASDGSDFQLTGPSGVTITGASCGASGNTVNIQLSGPIDRAGAYQLQLVNTVSGGTLIDACSQPLAPGQTISFTTVDTVSALIQYQTLLGCKQDTIEFSNAGGDGINTWSWTFDSSQQRSGQDQTMTYTTFGQHNAQLVVTNGTCSDTAAVSLSFNNALAAVFEATNLLCPNDKASFSDSSTGNIISYNWLFGDGTSSNLQYPPPKQYPDITADKNYVVQLIVSNGPGCYDTASQIIQSIANCYIAVPSAFTPNGDGINDYLYPLNAYKAVNLEFRVYNRYGNLVFQTQDWTIRWDGTLNGVAQPFGTYVWTLRYTNIDTGQKVSQKGTSVLIR